MVSVETYLRNQYRAHHYKSLENGKNQKKQGILAPFDLILRRTVSGSEHH